MHNEMQGHKPPVRHVPFRTIAELEQKLAALKVTQLVNKLLLEDFLDRYQIAYTIMDDGATMITEGIPEPLLEGFNNILEAMKKEINKTYKEIGVLSTEIPDDYDGTLRNSILNILINNKN